MDEVVVWCGPPVREILCRRLFDPVVVQSEVEFVRAMKRRPFLAFVEKPYLAAAGGVAERAPVVGVVAEPLASSVELLDRHPWLAHVVGSGLLQTPAATEHLGALYATLRLGGTDLRPFVGGNVKGRFTRMVRSGSRPGRIERLGAYLEEQGVGTRKVILLRDVAEELLTNAFYDAPAAAGLVAPIPRTKQVVLKGPVSCELAYGRRGDDLAFVRVRDPFGALSRERLVSVLRRCARGQAAVEIDETMGGAGLGLWRVFSAASFVAISVVRKRSSDILVGLYGSLPRRASQESCSIHLFEAAATEPAGWGDLEEPVEPDRDDDMENSVALRL